MDNLLIFGAGIACKKIICRELIDVRKAKIIGILDNDEAKQGKVWNGYFVYAPAEGIKLPYHWIVILGAYVDDKRNQLVAFGIPEQKIILRYDLYLHQEWFVEKEMTLFCKPSFLNQCIDSSKRNRIVLFTHNFTYNGGTIALLRMAQILIKYEFDILVISPEDGISRKEFERCNIPTAVDPNLFRKTLEDDGCITGFSLIVVNTISLASMLKRHSISVPIVWWLHDPEETYQSSGFRLQRIDVDDLDIYAAGDIGWDSFAVTYPSVQKQILMYGIPEPQEEKPRICEVHKKIIFALIGTFNKIKAQDILLDAISILPKRKMRLCEFWLIGNYETSTGDEIRNRANEYECVKMCGVLDRYRMQEIYRRISVVVTPSRTDIMPTVNGEAMMRGIPCIVGENVGTASLLQHEVNGLIFKQADAEDLAEKMEWMIDHRDRIPQMGAEARKVYEKYYTMEQFEKRVMKILAKHGIFSRKTFREEQDV